MSSEVAALLTRYQAEPYELEALGAYERWALSFFVEPANLLNPHLDTTLQLDVSAARRAYERDHAEAPGASFTAYLTWTLFEALRGAQLMVPFAVKLHHATGDLSLLDRLVQDLSRRWAPT